MKNPVNENQAKTRKHTVQGSGYRTPKNIRNWKKVDGYNNYRPLPRTFLVKVALVIKLGRVGRDTYDKSRMIGFRIARTKR